MSPQRAIYYNNFASHLLCAYNPNMYYLELPFRWSDDDWFDLAEMVAGFGFNVFEFWLEPRMFCRESLDSSVGQEYIRQMRLVIDRVHQLDMKAEMIVGLATVGGQWRTLCPGVRPDWEELRFLWRTWVGRFSSVDTVGIFPGDPGACSRNGCTAETYVDRSIDVAQEIAKSHAHIEIDFNTWGPPFFGWGNLVMPPDSQGEFIPEYQHTAWTFTEERTHRSMSHLVKRLDDFPEKTVISINMGFNPDGNPEGNQDARPWVREIARQRPILTWDFSLTEGENAVYPHYRFSRLFERRRQEREAAPYAGGICFTMTPLLNQLSLYEAAQSFKNPSLDPEDVAADFFVMLFGEEGSDLIDGYRLFEVIPDWGCYDAIEMPRHAYHKRMIQFCDALSDLAGAENRDVSFCPSLPAYRRELLWFAKLFSDLSSPCPDYDALMQSYWNRVYRIYDYLPQHVDPRPKRATKRLIAHFADWE